jgi:putative transposase
LISELFDKFVIYILCDFQYQGFNIFLSMSSNLWRFRRRSYRLRGYDYSWSGRYYLTLNVKNRIPAFGHIRDGKVHLTEVGQIAYDYLVAIPDHYKRATLGEFIVMPDHIHLILILSDENSNADSSVDHSVVPCHGKARLNDQQKDQQKDQQNNQLKMNDKLISNHNPDSGLIKWKKSGKKHRREFGKPISGSVSMIMNQYKSSVKRWCNQHNHEEFIWQDRFYDHIIRGSRAFGFISRYIANNPKKWEENHRDDGRL